MQTTERKPLRLWPGVAAAVVLVVGRYVAPALTPDAAFYGAITSMVAALVILLWWLFFSQVPWVERVGALALMAVTVFAVARVGHVSIRTGMMGLMPFVYTAPILTLALVAWAAATRRLAARPRRTWLVATLLVTGGAFLLLRTDGVRAGGSELAWRWSRTAEQRLLARAASQSAPVPPPVPDPAPVPVGPSGGPPVAAGAPPSTPAATPTAVVPSGAPPAPAEWPGFRGPNRDGVVTGVRFDTDWARRPPVELWRRPIGPGWSSFAVRGDFLYTQEQLGDEEIVACYRASTGEPVWRHRDAVRFWESNAGAGPRATPTIHGARVYAFGATGLLNALDARTGAVVWSRNVATDVSRDVPMWGFSSSPLVIDDAVIVAAAGTLAAYDITTGAPRWTGPWYGGSYSSPHRVTIGGATQVVLLGGPGAIGVDPSSGAVLWTHEWAPGTIVQPAVTPDGDLLVNTLAATGGLGIRRLGISQGPAGWTLEERWTSRGLKPYFNDYVVHQGHAYGFDGAILSCINLEDGARRWKGGRYGEGQMILVADEHVLIVLSEDGELALVRATPERFEEIARVPAIEGKTWNHPVLVGDVLFVRNGEEMAAFRLARAGG